MVACTSGMSDAVSSPYQQACGPAWSSSERRSRRGRNEGTSSHPQPRAQVLDRLASSALGRLVATTLQTVSTRSQHIAGWLGNSLLGLPEAVGDSVCLVGLKSGGPELLLIWTSVLVRLSSRLACLGHEQLAWLLWGEELAGREPTVERALAQELIRLLNQVGDVSEEVTDALISRQGHFRILLAIDALGPASVR